MPIPTGGYREVAEDLATRINSGEYPPGERLPTYKEFADLYSVSVTTVQRAIIILQDRGLIVGLQGRGLWVAEEPPSQPQK
ncbi:winged helix-turn-helix domain-containing protein [Micromonospora sp. WMMD1082]|uniref:GntR family transcriptional regulator n=1 Tax=Micromonospora sp. WMMD1082 TaxID=3016104 RepID=UPI002417D109|nr:winged helix-turn-helix domain-containing protein [Micromonospora sp. WMMD1082]MDG4798670.1 winged helix-turn-helix domain-containing protein [Micromonospora sp. WMMD1082]